MSINQEKLIQSVFSPVEEQSNVEKEEESVPKSRLGFYRALLSYDVPDLERVMEAFIYWSSFVEYLVFRRENIHTHEMDYKMAKASKRGNDVYSAKLRTRLNHLYKLPQRLFFDYKDRSRRHWTKAVFFTLTYARNLRLDEAWEDIGSDFNRWISAMRKRYGRIDVIRCWESQNDGYPHIHCILVFHDVDFEGKSIYKWYLVGFWADVNGKYDSWSVKLSYNEFWNIRSSDLFTFNKALFSD